MSVHRTGFIEQVMKEREKKNHDVQLNDLNRELYYEKQDPSLRKRRFLHRESIRVGDDFKQEKKKRERQGKNFYLKRESIFKKIFFILFAIFLVLASITFLGSYKGKKGFSNDLIDLKIFAPPFVDGGGKLELFVQVQNFNEQALELPDLVITYSLNDQEEKTKIIRRSLKNLKKGDAVKEKFEIDLLGKEGDKKTITATLEYRVKGSNSIFTKTTQHTVIIRSSIIQVLLSAAEQVVNGQDFITDVTVRPNVAYELQNIFLRVEYPIGFQFTGAIPDPIEKENLWYFPALKDERKIRIRGKIRGFPGEKKSIHFYIGRKNNKGAETILNHIVHTFEIQKPFLNAKIYVDGKDRDFIPVKSNSDIEGEIRYKNTLDLPLKDVQFTLYIEGNLFDENNIRVNRGEYDSISKRIIWTKNMDKSLAMIKTQEEGTLSFTLKTKDFLKDGERAAMRSELKLSIIARGENGKVYELRGIDTVELRGVSKLKIRAKSLYNDGPFENFGPIPPRAERKTTYTLLFQVINNPNQIENFILSTILPQYVRWNGKVFPSAEKKNIRYDALNGKFEWMPGEIYPETGTNGKKARELYIQVEVVPSRSHIGKTLKLAQEIRAEGDDQFTNVHVIYRGSDIRSTTKDSTGKNTGIVVE